MQEAECAKLEKKVEVGQELFLETCEREHYYLSRADDADSSSTSDKQEWSYDKHSGDLHWMLLNRSVTSTCNRCRNIGGHSQSSQFCAAQCKDWDEYRKGMGAAELAVNSNRRGQCSPRRREGWCEEEELYIQIACPFHNFTATGPVYL